MRTYREIEELEKMLLDDKIAGRPMTVDELALLDLAQIVLEAIDVIKAENPCGECVNPNCRRAARLLDDLKVQR